MAGWIDRQVDSCFDLFEPYKAVHNGAARLERINSQIKRVTRVLP